jgi:hypothetical protein
VVPSRTSSRNERDHGESYRRTVGRIVAAVTRRPVVLATGAMVCLGFVWQGYTAFLTTYLVEVEGIAQPTAAVALSAVLPRVE